MPKPPESARSQSQLRKELETLAGSDVVLKMMLERGVPLTREKYLALAYPDNLPHPWTAELESELPAPFQRPLKGE